MQLRHEKSMYPPRVKMTVVLKNPDTVLKLPVRIEGCLSDNQLDTELTFPFGMLHIEFARSIHYRVLLEPRLVFSSLKSSTVTALPSQEAQSCKILCEFITNNTAFIKALL